jgi:TRAP-type mannitol/chloroaromatic compound transport system permease small subunit
MDEKTRAIEWFAPLGFIACMAWTMWNGPGYIIAFGGASEQLSGLYTTATVLDYLFLVATILLLIIGIITVRPAKMEQQSLRGIDRLSLFIGRVTMMLIALVVLVMLYEVLMRYVFESGTLWANELSLWMAGFVFLLSGSYAMQQRCHIRIHLLYDVLPRPAKKACDVISTALILLFAFMLFYGAYGEASAKFLRWEKFGTAFDPPMPATIKPMILFGVILVAAQAVSNLIADWNKEDEYVDPDAIDEEEIAMLRKTLGTN